ncbi:hypothetical protein [Arthrobacter sp. NicSoilB8]|uniref:hypothetical protein n=1 Tax=Arthrobacter sp. NicSoilB8 TaxID=2830998 RepID=UPI001CC7AF42|nr:hypothetical protein [Arthrobacter sp. NicSoilB8]BCW69965.1 hypothetical protein NicSoilB8_10090 [Arthrobacter sp. NicSoilB8]
MAISVQELFGLCDPTTTGTVKWKQPVPLDVPGIYIVSTTADEADGIGSHPEYEADFAAIARLLKLCPDIRVDGRLANESQVAARLGDLWVPNASVLYVGLASTSLRGRVGSYYTTKLGKTSPHSGGWWLKTFLHLDDCHVHFAACNNVDKQEQSLIKAFSKSLSPSQKAQLFDPERVAPFANMEVRRGVYKHHGLSNYKVSTARSKGNTTGSSRQKVLSDVSRDPTGQLYDPSTEPLRPIPPATQTTLFSQVMSEKDRNRSYLRIPAAAKCGFPETVTQVLLTFQGRTQWVGWNPNGSRSGRLSMDVRIMRQIVVVGQRVPITVSDNRYSIL